MSSYRAWYQSLAGFLLVAIPGSAQAQKEEPVKLIYAVWQDSTAAENTLKHMSKGAKDQIAAYAVLVKDKDGNVDTRLRHHKTGGFSGVQSSQTIDSAIARLSESAPDSASGYAPNAPASRLSQKDLEKVVGMFDPGESALLLMSLKPAISEIQRALGAGAQGAPEVVVVGSQAIGKAMRGAQTQDQEAPTGRLGSSPGGAT
jgi:hypothetical protein